jgi:hypothetical protein
MGLLILIAGVVTALVAAGITCLWWLVGGNVAGWITVFVAFITAMFVAELLGAERTFSRLSKRGQRIVILLAIVTMFGGTVTYVFVPGTASWYLLTLPVIPLLLVLDWLRSNTESGAGPMEFQDGPWTAP